MDYYKTLGVAKDASDKDIKTAFRKLAAKHHPDKGGDHQKFIKIKEAYEVLSDAHKRAMYDHQQTAGNGGFHFNSNNFNANNFNNANNFQDIISQMFYGHRHNPGARPKNSDVRIKLRLNLEEVITGKRLIASYRLKNGIEESVDLDIPPGAKDGDTIRFSNLGDNSIKNVPRGDLYVIINVNNKPNWSRNLNDLNTKVKVNCLEMMVGTSVVIETLDNKQLELKIPPGTKNGTTFSVNGYGVPDIKRGNRGKLLITVEADIPKNLSEQSLSKIREILNETN